MGSCSFPRHTTGDLPGFRGITPERPREARRSGRIPWEFPRKPAQTFNNVNRESLCVTHLQTDFESFVCTVAMVYHTEQDERLVVVCLYERINGLLYQQVNMTVRKLALWTILGTTSATGLAHAMYEINKEGQVIDWSDTTGNGLVDSVTVDTDGVAGGNYVVQDTDGNGLADRVLEMDDSGAAGEVVAEGGVFEAFFDVVGSLF